MVNCLGILKDECVYEEEPDQILVASSFCEIGTVSSFMLIDLISHSLRKALQYAKGFISAVVHLILC